MSKFIVSFVIEVNNDRNPSDWIQQSISEQLEEGESIIDFYSEPEEIFEEEL